MNILETGIVKKLSGVGKLALEKTRQSRPEIGLVFGCLSILAGTVLACTKTKQAVDAYQTMKNEKDDIDTENEDTRKIVEDYARVYGRFVYKIVKIYGLSALLWIAGMSSVVGSHVDLRKQNTNLLLDSVAFKKIVEEYRDRVAKELGEDRERQLYFGAKEDEIEVIETNPETGATKVTRKKANVLNGANGGSKFARNFSARTSYEFDIRSYADYFLENRIKILNNRLRLVPFLTINDVYDELGMKPEYGRCEEGLDWGWVWNPMDPDGPNEIVIERLSGWEEVYDERENKTYYAPCLRIDFNCKPLRGLI